MNEIAESIPSRDHSESRHPIQIAARRSGLSVDVIRVWERRYNAVSPSRLPGGRRVYSDADISRLALLQLVTSAGRRIGDVATLDNTALAAMVEEDNRSAGQVFTKGGAKTAAERHMIHAMKAIEHLSPEKLRQVIASATIDLPLNMLLEQMLIPLLRALGDRCKEGEIRVGQEHMASAVIRHYLIGLLNKTGDDLNTLVFTSPSGHYHELGILMAAVTAESEGWRALYLGPDLPVAEIAAAATQAKAKAVALGLQCTMDEVVLMNEMVLLRETLPSGIKLIISGAAALQLKQQLVQLPALVPEDLAEFRRSLSALLNEGQ
jgi:DNA-binding transcriptional MerR regulator